MSSKRQREMTEKLDSCYKVVQQSGKKGISAIEVAEKLHKDRTTVHGYLNSLEMKGEVYNNHVVWFAKEVAQQKKPIDTIFLKRVFGQIDEITEDLHGQETKPSYERATNAFSRMRFLIAQLPAPLKEKMKILERQAVKLLNALPEDDFEEEEALYYNLTRQLLDKLSDLLYEEYDRR